MDMEIEEVLDKHTLACYERGKLTLRDFEWEDEIVRPHVAFDDYTRSNDIPIIDLQPLLVTPHPQCLDESSSITTIEELTRAARSTGFFQVANHGVPIRSLRTIQQYSRRFFDLPFEKKAEVGRLLGKLSGNRERQGDRYFCGYGPGNDSGARNKWWSEFLRVAPRVVGLSRVIDTLLPPIGHGDPSFSEAIEDCTKGLSALAEKLVVSLLKGIGITEEDEEFRNIYRSHVTHGGEDTIGLKINHYPKCPQPNKTLGLIPHTDVCILTILYQDEIGGLQVQQDGTWINILPRSDLLVVNVGDIFQVWSNDELKSGVHRVVLNATASRYSIGYFCNPNLDIILAPFPKSLKSQPCKFKSMALSKYRAEVFASFDTTEYVGVKSLMI